MNDEYKKELKDLKYKMQKAEKFSEEIPILSKEILSRKLSSDEPWIKFTESYKGLYLAWGLNRGLYETGTSRDVTNYIGEPYKEYLFNIYINTLSLYDSHEKFGLLEIKDNIPLFFFDGCNSTFYATDGQIEGLLEALVAWYKKAGSQIIEHNKQEEILHLTAQLEKLNKTEKEQSQ